MLGIPMLGRIGRAWREDADEDAPDCWLNTRFGGKSRAEGLRVRYMYEAQHLRCGCRSE
jgi:hypothetical protein